MDTIRRADLVSAVRALGFNPLSVDRITVDHDLTVSTRTRPTDHPLAAVACQHLGFPAEDVLSMEITPREVRVVLVERDEHGSKIIHWSKDPSGNDCPEYQFRTEVCNVGA